jgi:predicted Zn-dependent protease
MTIPPPDSHYLSAAIGWLELGNPLEANLELEGISSEMRRHPDALEAAWQIHAKSMLWEKCVAAAQEFTKVAPQKSFGWVHLSFALHELKRTREAHENLCAVLEQFPDDWLMRYNLACYSCQLGNVEEATRWLAGAELKGDAKQIKLMAKGDPDLAPLFNLPK